VILGQGPLQGELAELARQLGVGADVALHGFAPNRLAFMRRSALFVLSSAWEGLPTVLIEALACGCPVVSTDCPSGPAEILDGGRYGGLVPVGDSAGLARAIAAALDAPPPRQALVERAGLYSAASSSDRYLALMLGEPDPGGPPRIAA
jgi:glycosyltransferase involved in cell wall biosynthesis